ncbi:PcfJ domain-containing protein [Lactococcus taiwanensis]|uniref:PcfJ domain-containing protein n=1 Tax=Lactococcus taiwanensis TaxID=1151742 RepID=UPI0035199BC4
MVEQTFEEAEHLKEISEQLLKHPQLQPRISPKKFGEYFGFDFTPTDSGGESFNHGAVLLRKGEELPLKIEDWELAKEGVRGAPCPFLDFSILDHSIPYRIVTWKVKIGYLEEKGKHRLIFKIYRPYKIAYQPEFQIGLKREKEIVIYALSKDRVDIRIIEHGIHRLATLSDSLNFLGASFTQLLEESYPIYKELKHEDVRLPITWNEALLVHNKRELFSKRLKKDAGKKANKRSYFANYIYSYMERCKRFSEKEFARFDNWISTTNFPKEVVEELTGCNKRSYKHYHSLYRRILTYYLKDRYKVKHECLQDVTNMLVELNSKNIEFNFTSEQGFIRYHNDLIRQMRDCQRKKDKRSFSISKEWQPFVRFLRYKKKLTRLKSPLELVNEGNKMNHCVGGYSEWVRAGKCMIYHYDSPLGIPYTLEFVMNSEKKVVINQMFGKYNNPPLREEREVIEELVSDFNETRE